MVWFGADPGGSNNFGVARLEADGSFQTFCCSSADEALPFIDGSTAIGVDSPLWWSSATGGGREVDKWLRKTYGINSGTVQSANSLKGAALVQGVMLAMRLRERTPGILITETHPKAFLKAFEISRSEILSVFGLSGNLPDGEHEMDALLGAITAREGFEGRWTRDLSLLKRGASELNPKALWFGEVSYWWPDESWTPASNHS